MGALTIKNYSFETRIWELNKSIIPNFMFSVPKFLLVFYKNSHIFKILPWNRNDFISNYIRFDLEKFSQILDIKPTNCCVFAPIYDKLIKVNILYFDLQFFGCLFNFSNISKHLDYLFDSKKKHFNLFWYKKYSFFDFFLESLTDPENLLIFEQNFKNKFPDLYITVYRNQFFYSEEEVSLADINEDIYLIADKGLNLIPISLFKYFSELQESFNFYYFNYIYKKTQFNFSKIFLEKLYIDFSSILHRFFPFADRCFSSTSSISLPVDYVFTNSLGFILDENII